MDSNYEDLSLYFAEEGFNNADKNSKEMYKQQAKDRDELLDFIAKVLLTYTILDSVLSIGDTDKTKLRKEFSSIINNISVSEFKVEKGIMQNIFEKATKDKYYSDGFIMDIGIDFNLQKLTDKQIKEIVDKTIKGEIWSGRLWKNKKELEKALKVEVERFLTGKTNVNKIQKVVKDRFNQSAYNTRRLVQTEVAKCQSEVNEVFAKEHGIKEQLYLATLDKRTSKFCKEHDGKRYKTDDPNKPIPGTNTHPFCRSVLINVPFEDWEPKKRKDNITKEIIPYKDYENWLKDKGI